MINFHRMSLEDKSSYDAYLMDTPPRGCEYSFANQFLWGRQSIAYLHGCVAFFSHYYGKTVYPHPIGNGDIRAVIEEIIVDSRERGIPCRITGMNEQELQQLESWFPGQFEMVCDRDSYDYIYDIDDLADLRGKKYQKKRNHVNRFRLSHPDCRVLPLDENTKEAAQSMIESWFATRHTTDPQGDYLLESIAISKAFRNLEALGMEGIVLMEGSRVLAVTLGSRMGADTFDIHFEKAREDVDGAYAAVNCEFARYLRLKYPEVRYLNREDDLGLEGLRKAKLSYLPVRLVEKCRAVLREDIYEE